MKSPKRFSITLNYRQYELIIQALHDHIDSLLCDIHEGGNHNLSSDYTLLGKFETTLAKLDFQGTSFIRLTSLQSYTIDIILDYFTPQETLTPEDLIEIENIRKNLPVRSNFH